MGFWKRQEVWTLALGALVVGCFIYACDNSNDNNSVPSSCLDITGRRWYLNFDGPLDYNMILDALGGDPAQGEQCLIRMKDQGPDGHSFTGVIDGNRFKVSAEVGASWKLRGVIDPGLEYITGNYRLQENSGTFQAFANAPFTPTPTPRPPLITPTPTTTPAPATPTP